MPTTSLITCDMRSSVPFSRPFVALTTSMSGVRYGSRSSYTRRAWCEGITPSTISASSTASANTLLTATLSFSRAPGRNTSFSRALCMRCARSRS